VKSIRERALNGELLTGTWCNLGSSLTVEIAGLAGFDWLTIDLEHGSGGYESLVHQLQAADATPVAPIVRVAWNDPPRFKRVLDLGPSGVLVPYVSTAEEAALAARSMRYPPDGMRGVAKLNRACAFGQEFDEYLATANDRLLTVVQIETRQALENVGEIAAVEGVDVLFVGPLDLSVSLGIAQQFDHPRFHSAMEAVAEAAGNAGKAAGTLMLDPGMVDWTIPLGYRFVAFGSDGGMVAKGMREAAATLARYKGT
jgi:4-hydroxy-2-oxoheptanedioate aldolase